ncbi:uncharacterized protein [Epargyreus clarus]|uniref:uncharacterized protein isoform X2 n=1 Tax=Epargyreus clarus TaxID=520877 RepID=UPI003C30DEED
MSLRRSAYAPPVPKMPPGLIELMDGLARDVLKNNPENIFEFCAHHMQTLLKIRDGQNAPKPLLTLEQKIAKAQQKINQRAEQRRREYDEKVRIISAESFNKQQELPSCNIGDNSESVDMKEIENKTDIVKEEMKIGTKSEIIEVETEEQLNTADQKEIEKQSSDSCTNLEINDKEGKLEICADDDMKEDKKVCDVVTLDVIDSGTHNIIISANDETEIENTNEINETTGHLNDIEENDSEENQIVTVVIGDLDAESENKNDVNNSVTSIQTTPDVQLDNNIVNDKKIIITEQNSDLELQNQETESNNEMHIKPEVENNTGKDANEEIIATDNHVIEKVTLSPHHFISEDNTNTKDIVYVEQNEMQIDAPPAKNTLNENDDEIISITETKKDSSENPTEDLNEPEIKHEDDKILAVILSVKSPEPVVETNEPDSVENNVSNPKKEEILDFENDNENTPEAADDKSHNINSSMDLETAAITIQKVFRSFLFKTKTASYDDPTTVDMNLLNEDKEKEEDKGLNIKDRRHLGISRMDTVLQTVNEEKSLSLSTDDSSTLSSAATVIQAHVRGFLVRNKFNSNKTISTNSLIDSDAPSIPSLEIDSDNRKSKTVLNIHIVPEGGHFVSRDESILTSMDLSLDSSPPSSVNLHPLGYDKSERRKLKREDAIQSVSPPSNNSGKLSDDVDSEREVLTVNSAAHEQTVLGDKTAINNSSEILTNGVDKVAVKRDDSIENPTSDAADEMDVVTPFVPIEDRSSRESDNSSKLLHSGEFHDVVIPTNVTRSDTSVVRGE